VRKAIKSPLVSKQKAPTNRNNHEKVETIYSQNYCKSSYGLEKEIPVEENEASSHHTTCNKTPQIPKPLQTKLRAGEGNPSRGERSIQSSHNLQQEIKK
jgi:hypothetical protein